MTMILARYIGSVVRHSCCMALLVAGGLQWFIQTVRQLDDLGKGDLGLIQVAWIGFLNLPYDLYRYSPMLLLMGVVLGLGSLARHSELVIFRVSGQSAWRLWWAVLQGLAGLMLVLILAGEWLGPHWIQHARMYKAQAQSGGAMLHANQQIWLKHHNQFFVIEDLSGELPQKISRFRWEQPERLTSMEQADVAEYKDHQWHLKNIHSTYFLSDHIDARDIHTTVWPMPLDPQLLRMRVKEPEQMFLMPLIQVMMEHHGQEMLPPEVQWVFWQRLSRPFSLVLSTLLAVPVALGPLRSASLGSRWIGGIVAGFIMHLLIQLILSLGILKGMPGWCSALLPNALLGLGAGFWMKRLG